MPNIFERAMFNASNKPLKADAGITQGFDEKAENEMPEDEMLEEVSKRKPNSPEILMNTLRGDMRSVDARYQELADMVGEDVAMETPPEILALLQSQLASQQEGSMGIGALPSGQGVSPPPQMPAGAPPMPAPQMGGGMPPPPQMGGAPGAVPQGPQGFAEGGEVGNPSQGIAHFKGGGPVQQAVAAVPPPPPKSPEQIAAEQAEAARAAEAARVEAERQAAIKLQQDRDAAYSNPTTMNANNQPQVNAAFAPEMARRFMLSAQPGQQTAQTQRVAAQQQGSVSQYGMGQAPQFGMNPFAQQAPRPQMPQQGQQPMPQQQRGVPQYNTAGGYSAFGGQQMPMQNQNRAQTTGFFPASQRPTGPDPIQQMLAAQGQNPAAAQQAAMAARAMPMQPQQGPQGLGGMAQQGFPNLANARNIQQGNPGFTPQQVTPTASVKANMGSLFSKFGQQPQGSMAGNMAMVMPQRGDFSLPPVPPQTNSQQPRAFNEGGIASLGNFSQGIADAGRNGDTVLAHITPEQEQYLTELGGGATINPQTGLPEHFMGMQALGNMGTALATRAAPYLQQANVLAGRALYNPTFTEPTLTQTRTTLGTFGPKVAEGMEMYYPTLTQGLANSRLGQMVATGAERLSQTPAWAKMAAGVMSIPGATYIADKLDNPNMVPGNKNAPKVPGDTATGWVPPAEDEKGGSTPINWNNPPVPPSDAAVPPATEGDKTNQVIQNAIGKKTRGERLDEYMAENVPIFEKYLGGDKSYDQAQALFLLADMGLKFASTRKPGDTLVSSLARSASGIPAGLSALAANTEQARRQVQSAALTSGLQTLAAEDKAMSDLQKEIIKRSVSAGEVIPTDLGGGLTSYRTKQGQPAGMRIDDTVSNSFLNSRFTPQATKDDKGVVTGFDTPYVRVSPQAQTINLDKGTRERLAGEVSRQEAALSAIDDAIKEYSGAFGAKAFFSNLKNNLLVPVSPLDPNVMTEQQRTKINMAINIATKAIAKTGDTGNIAVAEQKAAADILGDKPGTFFSDPDTALKRMMTVRTSLANQRLNTASQLGWLNQDVQLEVPNLGTATDPIPQDKMSYLKEMSKTFPNGQVYVNIGGKVTPVLLSTLKD